MIVGMKNAVAISMQQLWMTTLLLDLEASISLVVKRASGLFRVVITDNTSNCCSSDPGIWCFSYLFVLSDPNCVLSFEEDTEESSMNISGRRRPLHDMVGPSSAAANKLRLTSVRSQAYERRHLTSVIL